MDRFGAQWVRHPETIERHWRERVRDDDLVLVPGDVSWAMQLEQARPDLEFLGRLPGTKLLVKGNHDYWWSSITQVRRALPPRMLALQGDSIRIGDVLVAGTRLWDAPGISFHDVIAWQPGAGAMISPEPTPDAAAEVARLFERELGRLQRALEDLEARARSEGDGLRIAATHYPPCGPRLEPTPAVAAMREHAIRHAVFGHLHALKRELAPTLFGARDGITFHLASCDWIGFAPVLVAET